MFVRQKVCHEQKLMEKLDYVHRNPVQRAAMSAKSPALSHRTREGRGTRFCVW